jgi:transposase-like protein
MDSNNIKIGDYILIKEEDEFVERTHNRFLQMARDFIEVCPKCKSFKISIRNRKTPKYRCQDCGNEFDDPKAKIVYKTLKQKREFGTQYSNPDE